MSPAFSKCRMGTPYARADFRATPAASLRAATLKAFAPSGPSSGYLPASMLDLPLDWKAMAAAGSMVGSGAIVVCDDGACMLDMALNAVRFLPQRIVRQVRAVPDRLAKDGGDACRAGPRARRGAAATCAAARRAVARDEAGVHLRPRAGRSTCPSRR